jgi:hypothetical protein
MSIECTVTVIPVASWFETREDALPHEGLRPHPRMSASRSLGRSIANGSRECATDDRLRDASRTVDPLYLPFQFGVRLLRKASMPSRKSSLM